MLGNVGRQVRKSHAAPPTLLSLAVLPERGLQTERCTPGQETGASDSMWREPLPDDLLSVSFLVAFLLGQSGSWDAVMRRDRGGWVEVDPLLSLQEMRGVPVEQVVATAERCTNVAGRLRFEVRLIPYGQRLQTRVRSKQTCARPDLPGAALSSSEPPPAALAASPVPSLSPAESAVGTPAAAAAAPGAGECEATEGVGEATGGGSQAETETAEPVAEAIEKPPVRWRAQSSLWRWWRWEALTEDPHDGEWVCEADETQRFPVRTSQVWSRYRDPLNSHRVYWLNSETDEWFFTPRGM